MKKLLRPVTFFLLLLLMGSCSSNQKKNEVAGQLKQLDPYSVALHPAQEQAKARNFRMERLNGESFSLEDQEGKVVLLNIWATWCAPCREETPDLVELYNKYKDQDFMIVGVSTDKQGPSVVKPFVEKYDVSYPIVIDDGTVMEKYGPTMGIPTSYIIGKDGNLKYFAVGALTNKELEPRIKKLINDNGEDIKS